MTDLNPQYRVRLTARYAFYDAERSHLFWDWPAGAIVDDPGQINLLEAHGVPVERIEIDPKPSPIVDEARDELRTAEQELADLVTDKRVSKSG